MRAQDGVEDNLSQDEFVFRHTKKTIQHLQRSQLVNVTLKAICDVLLSKNTSHNKLTYELLREIHKDRFRASEYKASQQSIVDALMENDMAICGALTAGHLNPEECAGDRQAMQLNSVASNLAMILKDVFLFPRSDSTDSQVNWINHLNDLCADLRGVLVNAVADDVNIGNGNGREVGEENIAVVDDGVVNGLNNVDSDNTSEVGEEVGIEDDAVVESENNDDFDNAREVGEEVGIEDDAVVESESNDDSDNASEVGEEVGVEDDEEVDSRNDVDHGNAGEENQEAKIKDDGIPGVSDLSNGVDQPVVHGHNKMSNRYCRFGGLILLFSFVAYWCYPEGQEAVHVEASKQLVDSTDSLEGYAGYAALVITAIAVNYFIPQNAIENAVQLVLPSAIVESGLADDITTMVRRKTQRMVTRSAAGRIQELYTRHFRSGREIITRVSGERDVPGLS